MRLGSKALQFAASMEAEAIKRQSGSLLDLDSQRTCAYCLAEEAAAAAHTKPSGSSPLALGSRAGPGALPDRSSNCCEAAQPQPVDPAGSSPEG